MFNNYKEDDTTINIFEKLRPRKLEENESIHWEKNCPKCGAQEMALTFDYKTKAYRDMRCRQPNCKYGN